MQRYRNWPRPNEWPKISAAKVDIALGQTHDRGKPGQRCVGKYYSGYLPTPRVGKMGMKVVFFLLFLSPAVICPSRNTSEVGDAKNGLSRKVVKSNKPETAERSRNAEFSGGCYDSYRELGFRV